MSIATPSVVCITGLLHLLTIYSTRGLACITHGRHLSRLNGPIHVFFFFFFFEWEKGRVSGVKGLKGCGFPSLLFLPLMSLVFLSISIILLLPHSLVHLLNPLFRLFITPSPLLLHPLPPLHCKSSHSPFHRDLPQLPIHYISAFISHPQTWLV